MNLRQPVIALVIALLFPLCCMGCSSSEPARCDTGGGAPLADSPWPKFRRDSANTGRIAVDLTGTTSAPASLLPPEAEPFEPITTSPIISADDHVLLVARERSDNALLRLFQFDPVSGLDEEGFNLSFPASATASIRSTPLLSANGRIIIPLENGLVQQYDLAGRELLSAQSFGPFLFGSPAIDREGTIFLNNTAGSFLAVCVNGVPRFGRLTAGGQSSIALFEGDPDGVGDDLSIVAGDDGRLRAFDIEGSQRWLFSAAGAIIASPVVDVARERVYAADTTGRVFAVRLSDGRRCRDFEFDAGARITASPALGRDEGGAPSTLFAATETGFLYALDLTGQGEGSCDAVGSPLPAPVPLWQFEALGSIRSSPAVATGGTYDVVVFGADDGCIYAVPDDVPAGADSPSPLWITCPPNAGPIGTSSPAIDFDGNVYIGTGGGRLFALRPEF
jgi:outer membrane protein assembly factor BamB